MKLNCLVIDDEPSGRKIMEEFIAKVDTLHQIDTIDNPKKAYDILEEKKVDLIFLDIQMPKLNGIDFLKSLENSPMVILTTAFSEYAIEGFNMDVVDYLLKPIAFNRFLKATKKAIDYHLFFNKENQNNSQEEFFYIKSNKRYEKIFFDEIKFIEAANNYILLHLEKKRLISYMTLKGMLEILPKEQFEKVHKSYVVSLSKIKSIDKKGLIIDEQFIPISRKLKNEILAKIIQHNLIEKR